MPSARPRHVLVTGGAGFIGSHLAEALWRRGDRVRVLDDLSTGRLENLAWHRGSPPLEFIQGDVGNVALLGRLLPGCDVVFHLAAVASVPKSVEEPVETHRHNLDAALVLLEASRRAAVRRLVFSSSCAIYGDADRGPLSESQPPKPLSPYALQKYAAEQYCRLFTELRGLETVALRYFNIFGPRQLASSPYSGVLARFCDAVTRGQPIMIFGDGHQSRDFLAVENVVYANQLAAEAPARQVAGRVYNIASGTSRSLLDLVASLRELSGQPIEPVFAPARAGDIRRSEADITAARRDLGYSVRVPWETGLLRTLESYRGGSA